MPRILRKLCGVLERDLRGEAVRQHDASHRVLAERIDRDRRAQRQIDAAGNAEQHAGEPVFLHVIAQAKNAGRIVGLVALEQRQHRPRAAPAVVAPCPAQCRDVLDEVGQLRRDRQIAVEGKRGAVEDELVLAADLVEIDERQSAFGDACDRNRQPDVGLVARVRRAVRNQQNFGAGLGEALDDVLVILGFFQPDVLADRHTDADAFDRHRPRGRPAREQALLVEHAVIRQIALVAERGDPPAVEQRASVKELALVDPGGADQHRGPAIGGFLRQAFDGRPTGRLERSLSTRSSGG